MKLPTPEGRRFPRLDPKTAIAAGTVAISLAATTSECSSGASMSDEERILYCGESGTVRMDTGGRTEARFVTRQGEPEDVFGIEIERHSESGAVEYTRTVSGVEEDDATRLGDGGMIEIEEGNVTFEVVVEGTANGLSRDVTATLVCLDE